MLSLTRTSDTYHSPRVCPPSRDFCGGMIMRRCSRLRGFFLPKRGISLCRGCGLRWIACSTLHPKFSRPLPVVAATTCGANMEPQTFAHEAQWPSSIRNPRLELCDFFYYYLFVPDITLSYLQPSNYSLFLFLPPFLHSPSYAK